MSTGTKQSEDGATKPEGDKRVPLPTLVDRLGAGWKAATADVARDLVGRWAETLGTGADIREPRDSALRFNCDLGMIRLRGTSEAQCLLVAGKTDVSEAVQEFWARAKGPGKAVFVLALTPQAMATAQQTITQGRAVFLDSRRLVQILTSTAPLEALKAEIRLQIPLTRLIPFDAQHAANGHMFAGRQKIITRLAQEDHVSFALAGPGRIGKTSVLRRYREHLIRTRAPESAAYHYIDMMRCESRDDDEIARFIVNSVDSNHKNHRLTHDRLELTLMAFKERFGPIGLLLDEVDEFVSRRVFHFLGQAAKKDLCRLILGGKGELLKKMLESGNPFQGRVTLLRLEPLDDQEAVHLLFGPIRDLGFDIREPNKVRDHMMRWTGNAPHLIQFYGQRLCHLLTDSRLPALDISLIDQVRDDQETFTYFSDPLFKANDPKLRYIALAMIETDRSVHRLEDVQALMERRGMPIMINELWEKLNELSILNLLAWKKGAFQVANESLSYYARETGFLKLASQEAKRALGIL